MIHQYTHPEDSYRQFSIAKKNKKSRRICAPSPTLLAKQRALLPGFESRFNALAATNLENTFHGFLKNRNIVTCAQLHKNYSNTITMDISNCFDSITREMLVTSYILPYLPPECFHANGSLAQGLTTVTK